VISAAARNLPTIADAPRMTTAVCELLREIEVIDDRGNRRSIQIPVERPLTLLVDGQELVTLMTLGACPELLALGYLFNQRLIEHAAQIESIAVDWAQARAAVRPRSPLPEIEARSRRRIASAGCGQGSVISELLDKIDQVRLPAVEAARIGQDTLLRVLEIMRRHHGIHRSAGSVHSCALFHGAELMASVEDVGRHNAVDTITGWMLLHGIPGADKILFTTARLTGEMVMKCAQSGIPIAVSRNGVSTMAYDLARRLGMSLFGRAAHRHFLCYVGADRFDAEPAAGQTAG
jgi:FdhD protein